MIYRSICLWSLCVCALHLSVMFHWQQWVFSRADLQEYMSLITVCVCISASCVTDSSECSVEMIYRSICLWSLCVSALPSQRSCFTDSSECCVESDLQEYMSLITVCVVHWHLSVMCHWQQWVLVEMITGVYVSDHCVCVHCISASCFTDSSECSVEMIYNVSDHCVCVHCISASCFTDQQWVFSREIYRVYVSDHCVCLHCISASCFTDSSECSVEMIYRSICLLITVCVCTASQRHVSLTAVSVV